VGSYQRLLPRLRELAAANGLVLEPGRSVIEVRSGTSDKGRVVDELMADTGAKAVLFIGDDLGDLEAMEAVGASLDRGLAGLRVCVANPEVSELRQIADVIVEGPDGVMEFLRRLAADIRAHTSDN